MRKQHFKHRRHDGPFKAGIGDKAVSNRADPCQNIKSHEWKIVLPVQPRGCHDCYRDCSRKGRRGEQDNHAKGDAC